jgi:APA family basic amino acid/polyamine antiporter
MGLGSIIGTGVFVSIGIAAGVAGAGVIIAIVLAAAVATCNALSSAQLAANHPVSGGTYEYGYRYLRPSLGFAAGWMFLCAKSASAATAAIGFAGYLLSSIGYDDRWTRVAVAMIVVIVLTIIVLLGVRQSNRVNIVIVALVFAALLTFIFSGLPALISNGRANFMDFGNVRELLQATALMFVAYTGYGRIATMGEEVREPRATIPRAIGATLWTSAALYAAVAIVAIGAAGAKTLADAAQTDAAPLEAAARLFAGAAIARIVAIGAMAAMIGVSLNLILGLSRVLLAMARRGDMPVALARLNESRTTPSLAVIIVGIVITGLVMIGNVKTTWSFSTFTVLIYYAITNAAALRLPREDRLYQPWIAWCGFVACLLLAFFVEPRSWLIGLAILAVGLLWHAVAIHRRGAVES